MLEEIVSIFVVEKNDVNGHLDGRVAVPLIFSELLGL